MTYALPERRRWQGWTEHGEAVGVQVTRCAFCDFTVSGELEATRAAATARIQARRAQRTLALQGTSSDRANVEATSLPDVSAEARG